MAQSGSASVLNPINNISQEQLVVPDEYIPDENDQDVRREKYLEQHVRQLDLNCSICSEVPDPRKFLTGHCGASICTACLDKSFDFQPNRCPSCNTRNVRKDCFGINRHGKKMIEETLKATCTFECGTVGKVRDIVEHQNHTCPLRMVKCPTCPGQYRANLQEDHDQKVCKIDCLDCNQNVLVSMMAQHMQDTCIQMCRGCNTDVLSRNMRQHMNNECMKRPVSCDCGRMISFDTIELHRSICPLVMVECPDCKTFIARGHLSNHRSDVCPETLITCELCEFLCYPRREIDAHKADKSIHWEKYISEQQEVNKRVEAEMNVLRERTLKMSKILEQSLSMITSVVRRLESADEDTLSDISALKGDARILRTVCQDVTCLVEQSSHYYSIANLGEHVLEQPVCKLPQQIEYNSKQYKLCDFSNKFCGACHQGSKQRIPVFGKHYGYYESDRNLTMCLKCMASIHTDVKNAMDEMQLQNSMNEISNVSMTRLKELRTLNVYARYVATSSHNTISFIPAEKYGGMLPGHVFKTGPRGTGYYIDTYVAQPVAQASAPVVREEQHAVGTTIRGNGKGYPVVYHQNLDELKGKTVRRGPHWMHNNEDGHGIGIIKNIYNISDSYHAEVEWENGNKFNHYRIGSRLDLLFA